MEFYLNIQRLGLLLKQYFVENYQRELMQWAIFILIFAFIPSTFVANAILFVRGVVFAGSFFSYWQNKARAVHFFMVPATVLEKTVAALLITLVYYVLMFALCHTVGSVLNIGLRLGLRALPLPLFRDVIPMVEQFPSFFGNVLGSVGSLVFLQSLFLLGSAFFRRYAILKTLLSVFLLMIAVSILGVMAVGLQSDLPWRQYSDVYVQFSVFSPGVRTALGTVAQVLVLLALWAATYFTLARKQV